MENEGNKDKETTDLGIQETSSSTISSFLDIRADFVTDRSTLSDTGRKQDYVSKAKVSFDRDDDQKVKYPCTVCYNNGTPILKATHFCNECCPFGHFLCENCLACHGTFTDHKNVQSLAAARESGTLASFGQENLKQAKEELDEKNKQLQELKSSLQQAITKIQSLSSRDQDQVREASKSEEHGNAMEVKGETGLDGKTKLKPSKVQGRQVLTAVMNKAKDAGAIAYMTKDKLFINGQLYTADTVKRSGFC